MVEKLFSKQTNTSANAFIRFSETNAQWKISLGVSLRIFFEMLKIFETKKLKFYHQKSIKSYLNNDTKPNIKVGLHTLNQ